MRHFMAVFTATPESRARSGSSELNQNEREARQAAGVRAWNAWVDTHKEHIVHHGSPLGKTKRADAAGGERQHEHDHRVHDRSGQFP